MKQHLTLHLEGPLSGWGADGAAELRRSAPQPTERSIFGLLRAAKGKPRGCDWPELSTLRVRVETLRAGQRLWDYHTAASIRSADGSTLHETGISWREYRSDAAYAVHLEGPADLLADIRTALEDPVFLLGLGRRACMPSRPILCVREGVAEGVTT